MPGPSAASMLVPWSRSNGGVVAVGEPLVFWLDPRVDPLRLAEDGGYADVLRRHLVDFDGVWGDIAPVAFACTAWRLAIPPAADPGFIRCHHRVLTARCEENTWDGSLTARITVVSPLPSALSVSKAWWHDRGWQEWPQVFGQFVEPAQRDLAKYPFIRPVLHMDVPVPLDNLPATPDGPDDTLAATAQRALSCIVRELNRFLAPVVAQLEGVTPPP
jgi:hypothetical protein